MNLKRAVLTGALLWILIFFEVSVLMFGLVLENSTLYIVHYLLLILLVGISAYVYFKGKKIRKGFYEGFLLGIVFVIVGLILDLIITVPLFVKDYGAFFSSWLLLGLLEVIIITSIYGSLKK